MEDAIRKGRAGNRPVRVSPKRVRRHSPKMIAAQCTIIFFTVAWSISGLSGESRGSRMQPNPSSGTVRAVFL